jgi:hypothetical protein
MAPTDPVTATLEATSPTTTVCPYLLAEGGGWRAATATRDHRCVAVAPPTPLAAEKQRRLCLVAEHAGCATYRVAAGSAGLDGLPPASSARGDRPSARPFARTTPLVLDHGRVAVALPALRGEPRLAQALLLGLMGLAFVAIVVARLSVGIGGGTPAGAGGVPSTPQASLPVTAIPPETARPTQRPEASAVPERTLVPTQVDPSKEPGDDASPAVAPASYKVKRGDTLSGIATKFGTTWQVLAELNGIKDPSRLRVGQVLDLP